MAKRLIYLIETLLQEQNLELEIPEQQDQQEVLYRSLQNIRHPAPVTKEFLYQQDRYLQEKLLEKGLVTLSDMEELAPQIYLWQGDITRLQVDAIVNAANQQLLGCFVPNHRCIDNAIHIAAGVQLRLACQELMSAQGHEEPTGQAKITPAYNLPSSYVLHTVGPIVQGPLTEKDCQLLASSYRACLELAVARGLKSMAFCCISTGEFGFPQDVAARIAVQTVRDFLKEQADLAVVFNVFKDSDWQLYQREFAR